MNHIKSKLMENTTLSMLPDIVFVSSETLRLRSINYLQRIVLTRVMMSSVL